MEARGIALRFNDTPTKIVLNDDGVTKTVKFANGPPLVRSE